MAANDDRRREEEALQAYHDGELGYWARWKVQRRLERSPGLRRELAELEALSGLVLESAPEVAVPDLWTGIARGLSAVDAERAAGEPAAPRAVVFEWLFRPAGALERLAPGTGLDERRHPGDPYEGPPVCGLCLGASRSGLGHSLAAPTLHA